MRLIVRNYQFILSYLLIALFLFASSCTSKPDYTRPNIVIIFTDDQGYGDLGCYGASGFNTPNLDKLASEGLRFTNFYAAQAVCSASRAALMTGCYPNRVGITGALMPYSKIGISDNETTIAEIVKQKGYKTAIFGKWHLGHHKEFLPTQHGFDEYLGLPYSNDMWPVDYDGTTVLPDSPRADKLKYPPLPLISGNDVIDTITNLDEQAELTTIYTERAVDFINRNRNNPFLLYVPHSMPHVPLGVSSKFKGKSEQGMYGDVIMEIDWSVGEILKAIEDNDISDNTIVIFTSDNGPWLNFGNHAGSTGGLREGKGVSFEGGQRVPCIMKWPGNIPEGKVTSGIASTIDILPTIATILGVDQPYNKIDGINILPLLKDVEGANPRDEFLYYYGRNNLEAVRKGNWKLVFPHNHRSYEYVLPGNDGWPGPYRKGRVDTLELYNLVRDPGERYNVIQMYPSIVKELKNVADKARKDLGDDLQSVPGDGRRKPGYLK